MKKVGILTLNGNFNIGNRLQNHALETVLRNMECHVETIWFTTPKSFLIRKSKDLIFRILGYRKKINFLNFSRQYINIHYYFKKNIADNYDYLIVGSDQVWNYNFPDFDTSLLLDFSPYEKNISYAASFGINQIEEKYKDLFLQKLNNIKYISVRESAGKKIINDLLPAKKVEVLLDPTMLLSAKEWDEIAKKPKKMISSKYIFTYFLGNVSSETRKVINSFAKKHDFEIIDILNKKSQFFNCGPSEFLYLEKQASLILTDSFHSCVFAILNHTPFIVFDRDDSEKKMTSRIENLIKMFKLTNRFFSGSLNEDSLTVDYEECDKLLSIEKEKSIDFLKKSLNIK